MAIMEFAEESVNGFLAGSRDFLVEVRILPHERIQVFVDGDEGIRIDRCAAVSRSLAAALAQHPEYGPMSFSLEVSSPGLEHPLKLLRQYRKNVGRKVEVVMSDGSRKDGRLVFADGAKVILEYGGKGEPKQEEILFNEIKTTKVQVVF